MNFQQSGVCRVKYVGSRLKNIRQAIIVYEICVWSCITIIVWLVGTDMNNITKLKCDRLKLYSILNLFKILFILFFFKLKCSPKQTDLKDGILVEDNKKKRQLLNKVFSSVFRKENTDLMTNMNEMQTKKKHV